MNFNPSGDSKSEILTKENFRKLFELIDMDILLLLEKLLNGVQYKNDEIEYTTLLCLMKLLLA